MRAKDKAAMFQRQGRVNKCEEQCIIALSEDFDDPSVIHMLGTIYYQTGRVGLAANMFMRSLEKKDTFECWNNLGNCYKVLNKDIMAGKCFREALAIKDRHDKDYADANNNLGTLHINTGEPEKGEPFIKECLRLEPEHPDGHWNNALIKLEQGKYNEGFADYHYGFKTGNRMYRTYGREIPEWKGEKGKHVIVWGEQGLGDELMFASILPDVIRDSASVVLECHPNLVSIFKESFPGISVYGTRKDQYIDWVHNHPEINARIAIGELGKIYRNDIKDFPGTSYLKAPYADKYKSRLDAISSKLKVGIIWKGGSVKTRQDFRSIPLEKWQDILSLDADFINLQYTPDVYEAIAKAENTCDARIHQIIEGAGCEVVDYGETASLVDSLDLVIAINTSIHHLAGGLGKECWTLTPRPKAWRYYSPDNKTVPWYGSCTIYQQEKEMQWDDILSQVKNDLELRISEKMEVRASGR
jgi:tetratricopeptide (TPR) repeat protein